MTNILFTLIYNYKLKHGKSKLIDIKFDLWQDFSENFRIVFYMFHNLPRVTRHASRVTIQKELFREKKPQRS